MLIRTLLLFTFVLPVSLAAIETLPKVAIVPGGDPKPEALLALSEAKLFELKGLELLERTEIDKVLAEQNLSGLFDAVSAIELGRILKADLFAVLETTSIVIFDAQTGLRFVDETLPESIEEAAQIVGEAVTTAIEKRRKLDLGNLVTFGVLEVRNADFPVDRDTWCRAVAGMLERELLRRGGAVLERSRLQHVNRERQLTDDTTNDLLASMKLINLEFTRGEIAYSFKLTARIDGEIYRAESLLDKPLDAVRQITEQLLGSGTRERTENEAARFAKEAKVLENLNKIDDAMEKIEVSVALEPENSDYRKQLCEVLLKQVMSPFAVQTSNNSYQGVELIDAETTRRTLQNLLRLNSLLDGLFPPDYEHYLYNRTNSFSPFNRMRRNLTVLANHSHPEFKGEMRSFNRRVLDLQMTAYRASVNRVVDQETFRQHLRFMDMFSFNDGYDLVDFVTSYAEIIETTLRLTHEYQLDTDPVEVSGPMVLHGDPDHLYDARLLRNIYRRFTEFIFDFRAKRIPETNSRATAIVLRTIRLMEQDSRWMPRIYAWIARNRNVPAHDIHRYETNQHDVEAYFEKVKSYLADLPKEMAFSDYHILYNELFRLIDLIERVHRNEAMRLSNLTGRTQVSTFNSFPLSAEIFELADSRNEFAKDFVVQYIIVNGKALAVQTDNGDTEFLKQIQQVNSIIPRQIALAEHLKFNNVADALKKQATDAMLFAQEKNDTRHWKAEINLFPPENGIRMRAIDPGYEKSKPLLRGNMLYWVLRNSDDYYLGCVNVETLEKRSIPFYKGLEQRRVFHYVDDFNAYFRDTNADSRDTFPSHREIESDMGLLILPLDGSPPWSLTLQDDLPSDRIRALGTLGDWCYATVGDDWIIRIDLKTRQWEQLSSSRAKTGKTPFVDGRQLVLHSTLDDPKRERILFLDVNRSFHGGLWAIEKDGTFVQVNLNHETLPFAGQPGDIPVSAPRPYSFFDEGNKLLFEYSTRLYVYDFETDAVSPMELGRSIVCAWNGYLWGGVSSQCPWGRRPLAPGSEIEPLPVPEELSSRSNGSPWFPRFCASTPGGKGLVVAGTSEIILLHFE